MQCTNFQSLSSSLLFSPPQAQHHRNNNKHQILMTNKPCICILKLNGNGKSLTSSRVPAVLSTVLPATTSLPPAAAKLSVLLKTGGVCLIAYWIANFVVPNFILKDFQSNKPDEDAKNPADDEL